MLRLVIGLLIIAVGMVPLCWAGRLFGGRRRGRLLSLATVPAVGLGVITIWIGVLVAYLSKT